MPEMVELDVKGFNLGLDGDGNPLPSDKANAQFINAYMRHRHFLLRAENGISKRVRQPIIQALKEIRARMANEDRPLSDWSRRHYDQLQGQLTTILGGGMAKAQGKLGEELAEIAAKEHQIQSRTMRRIMPIDFPLDLSAPDINAINTMVDSPIGGIRWAERMEKNYGLALGAMRQELAVGVALGENPRRTARRLTKRVKGLTAARAERIARTETQRVANTVAVDLYDRNSDVIKGVRAVETLDGRTCLVCANLDGQTFAIKNNARPMIPVHAGCRGFWSPVTYSINELHDRGVIDKNKISKNIRDRFDGKVPRRIDYHAWFKQQDETFQREILGPGRFKLFKRGMPLHRMVADLKVVPINKLPVDLFGPFPAPPGFDIAPPPPRPIPPPVDLGDPDPPRPDPLVPLTPPPAPPPLPSPPSKFPKKFSDLEDVGPAGGTTGARIMRDVNTDKKFIVKRGVSAEHLEAEMAVDNIYRDMGVNVPEHKRFTVKKQPVKVSEFIEGATPLSDLTGEAFEQARMKVREDFAADALLGNWDVVGLDMDNILVDASGKVWRIDNGGSLGFRARGELKNDIVPGLWDTNLNDVWSMRDPNVPDSANRFKVFGNLNFYEVMDRFPQYNPKKLHRIITKHTKRLPTTDMVILRGRVDEFTRMANHADTWFNDGINQGYADRFGLAINRFRARKLHNELPDQLGPRHLDSDFMDSGIKSYDPYNIVDENGDFHDALREADGFADRYLQSFIEENGGDYKLLHRWSGDQASDSWEDTPQAWKHMVQNLMYDNLDDSKLFFKDGKDTMLRHARDMFDEFGQVTSENTLIAMHAYTHELLDNIDFPTHKKMKGGKTFFDLIRTESRIAVDAEALANGIPFKKFPDTIHDWADTKKKWQKMPFTRGAIESFSMFKPYYYQGEIAFRVHDVPLHRIIGSYLTDKKYPNSGIMDNMFAGIHENEFVTMTHGLKNTWMGEQ